MKALCKCNVSDKSLKSVGMSICVGLLVVHRPVGAVEQSPKFLVSFIILSLYTDIILLTMDVEYISEDPVHDTLIYG